VATAKTEAAAAVTAWCGQAWEQAVTDQVADIAGACCYRSCVLGLVVP